MQLQNYLVIDDYYTPEELKLVEEEILALRPYGLPDTDTMSTKDKKTGTGLFLDKMFLQNRSVSKILRVNRKLFSEDMYNQTKQYNAFFGHLFRCNLDSTLVNYYVNSQEYKAHTDKCIITAISFFKIGEFTGGDFCFPEYNEIIKFKHNRMVIFPSCMLHQALPIQAKDDSCRVSIAQFLKYKDD